MVEEQVTSTQDTLAQIKDNSANVIHQQKELSEETCPLLRSYLRGLRLSRGTWNKHDVREESAFIIRELNYISEHNFLFYLVLTRRYDLIRELFFGKEEFAREVALVREIQREEERTQNVQQNKTLFDPLKSSAQNIAPSMSYWSQYPNGIAPIDLLYYYEKQSQHINQHYDSKRVEIFNNAFEARITRLNKAVEHLKKDPKVSHEEVEGLQTLINKYTACKDEIMNRTTVHPDGTIDSVALEQQCKDMAKLDDEFSKKVMAFYARYPNDATIANLAKQEVEATEQSQTHLARIEQEREQKLQAIRPHLEQALTAAKEDAIKSIDVIIEHLNECSPAALNKQQKDSLRQTVEHLMQQKEVLKDAKDYATVQQVLRSCSQASTQLQHIVKPSSFSSRAFNELKEHSKLLHQMSVSATQEPKQIAIRELLQRTYRNELAQQVQISSQQNPGQEQVSESLKEGVRLERNISSSTSNQIPNSVRESIQNMDLAREQQSKFKSALFESRLVVKDDMQILKAALQEGSQELARMMTDGLFGVDEKPIAKELEQTLAELVQYDHLEDIPEELVAAFTEECTILTDCSPYFEEEFSKRIESITEIMEKREENMEEQSLRI
jgi:hypothetical protein